MQILRRVDCPRRGFRRLADQGFVYETAVQQRLYLNQPLRPIASANNPDMGVSHPAFLILIVKQSDACKAEITPTLSEFPEGPTSTTGPERQMQLGNNLIVLPDRRQRPGEEVSGAYHSGSGDPDKCDFPLAGHGDARQFRGRVA